MSRSSNGAHLWLRPVRKDCFGAVVKSARWIVKDAGRQVGTGCSAGEREEAERKFAACIAGKYAAERRERLLSEIGITDVIKIYPDDVAPGHSQPEKTAERAERLLEFFGSKRLNEITGVRCRDYAAFRHGKTSNKRKGGAPGGMGGAKRDSEDLRAATALHRKEGYHRAVVSAVLPERGKARQRWLTRSEAARRL